MLTYEQLRRLLGAILAVILVGTLGYVAIEGARPFDALWMTVVTLTTVGYEEVFPLSTAGRVFTMALLAVGLGLIFYSITAIIGMVMEGRLASILGRRALESKLKALKDHTIVCGFGRMGTILCHELTEAGRPFVVIDKGEEPVGRAQAAGYVYVRGDASEDAVLDAAGIDRARALVAVLSEDADNVFVCMTAREKRPDLRILARAGSEGSERKLRRAGADRVISPYLIGGQRLAHALLRPAVVDFIEVASASRGMDLALEEVRVVAGSKLVGTPLRETGIRDKAGLIIVAIKRGADMLFNPAPDTRLAANDILVAFGAKNQLQALDELLAGR